MGLEFEVDPVTLQASVVDKPSSMPRARFVRVIEKDEAASEEAGRPIHREVELIHIYIDEHSESVERVTDDHRRKYPREYQRFMQTHKPKDISGTSLAEMFIVTRSRAEDYAALGVFTVEQLAGLPDHLLQSFGAGTEKEREAARAYLNKVENGENAAERLALKVAELEKALAEARADNQELTAALKQLKGSERYGKRSNKSGSAGDGPGAGERSYA